MLSAFGKPPPVQGFGTLKLMKAVHGKENEFVTPRKKCRAPSRSPSPGGKKVYKVYTELKRARFRADSTQSSQRRPKNAFQRSQSNGSLGRTKSQSKSLGDLSTPKRRPQTSGSRPRSSTSAKSPFSEFTQKRRGYSGVSRRLTPFEKCKAELSEAFEMIAQLQSESQNKTDFILAQKQSVTEQTSVIEEMAAEALYQLALRTTEVVELKQEFAAVKEEREEQIKYLTLDLQKAAKSLEPKNEIIREIESLLTGANLRVATLEDTVRHLETAKVEFSEELFELTEKLVEADEKLVEIELQRRELHNTVQEMRGNIQVFCRVRPPPDVAEDSVPTHIEVTSGGGKQEIALKVNKKSATGKEKTKMVNFTFDRIFASDTTQHQVFDEISQMVQSALDGYNVTIFAYGQTGSGKTYTMEGTAEDAGLIPRAVEQIFLSAGPLKALGWTYTYEASFLEIYNEKICDLLSDEPAADQIHEIVRSGPSNSEANVSGLTLVPVETPEAVASLLATATLNRATGATAMNATSSRSHSVFSLKIVSVDPKTDSRSTATVNLVDLAGSERLVKSGTGRHPERLKETRSINKSLSNLGIVISALKNKEKHVPYRNSKLTLLLQPALGGQSKCLMLANVSSDPESAAETLSSLNFASKVNQCYLDASVPARSPTSPNPRW